MSSTCSKPSRNFGEVSCKFDLYCVRARARNAASAASSAVWRNGPCCASCRREGQLCASSPRFAAVPATDATPTRALTATRDASCLYNPARGARGGTAHVHEPTPHVAGYRAVFDRKHVCEAAVVLRCDPDGRVRVTCQQPVDCLTDRTLALGWRSCPPSVVLKVWAESETQATLSFYKDGIIKDFKMYW